MHFSPYLLFQLVKVRFFSRADSQNFLFFAFISHFLNRNWDEFSDFHIPRKSPVFTQHKSRIRPNFELIGRISNVFQGGQMYFGIQ